MKLRSVSFTAALLLAVLASMPSAGHAFGLAGGGGKLGYANPENLDGTVMVGGHLEFAQSGTQVHLVPNLMYWKVDRQSDVNPNFDVYYHFRPEGRPTPYVGGGLGLNMRNSDITGRSSTDLGANLIGGMRFPGESNNVFMEGRFTAADVSQVAVMAGITFGGR